MPNSSIILAQGEEYVTEDHLLFRFGARLDYCGRFWRGDHLASLMSIKTPPDAKFAIKLLLLTIAVFIVGFFIVMALETKSPQIVYFEA